jgi:hypothetical protein
MACSGASKWKKQNGTINGYLIFRSRQASDEFHHRLSRLFYPVLRSLRELLLKLLGRNKINNPGIPGKRPFLEFVSGCGILVIGF